MNWRMAAARFRRAGTKMFGDRSGAAALFFALVLPVVLGVVGLAVDYSYSQSYKQQLQAAADSAVLSATSGLVSGGTVTQAQTTAIGAFVAGAPTNAPNPKGAAVTATINNDLASVLLTYTGARPALFAKLYGGAGSLSVKAQAQASLFGGSGKVASYTGRGSIWGDPHLSSDKSSGGYFDCDTTGATWYNALSDSGIEINFNCAYDPYFSAVYMQTIVVIMGSNITSMTATPASYDSRGNIVYAGSYQCGGKTAGYWCGSLTFNGVYHQAKSTVGNTYYIGSGSSSGTSRCDSSVASTGSFLYQQIQDTSAPDESNSIQICYFNGPTLYQIQINYDQYEQASISVSATNAGLCGVPGGMFGQTVVGADDLTSADFTVPSSTSTVAQYKYTTCTSGGAAQGRLKLVQ